MTPTYVDTNSYSAAADTTHEPRILPPIIGAAQISPSVQQLHIEPLPSRLLSQQSIADRPKLARTYTLSDSRPVRTVSVQRSIDTPAAIASPNPVVVALPLDDDILEPGGKLFDYFAE